MKKIIIVIALVFAFTLGTIFSADIATAVKPPDEVIVVNTEPIAVTGNISSDPACPAENVQHWNKIVFIVQRTYFNAQLGNLLENSSYEMIVQVNPEDINEVLKLVAVKLNADDYREDSRTGTVVNPQNNLNAVI